MTTAIQRYRIALATQIGREDPRRAYTGGLDVRPMAATLGAEVLGVDLSRSSDAELSLLKKLLLTHKVIVLRDQELTQEAHLRVGRFMGTLEIHPALGHAEGSPYLIDFQRDKARPGFENVWHSDQSWAAIPPAASMLYCLECPEGLGDTLWADTETSLLALAEEERAELRKAHGIHSYSPLLRLMELRGDPLEEIERAKIEYPDRSRPVIATHPHTGKECLFVNELWTREITGDVTGERFRLLLSLIRTPEFQMRLKWKKGTVALWDNLATQHYATNDYFPHFRRMRRATVTTMSRL